jgi:hypothetical protein
MSMSSIWKISLISSMTGALGALTATGCGATGSARVSSTKKAANTKSGYIDTPNGEVNVQYIIKDDHAVIGGDVLLPLDKIREKSNVKESSLGLFGAGQIWPNGRVPYIVDANFCCTAELKEAIQLWAPSGLTFVPKTQADRDYLVITNEMPNTGACGASYGIGRQGGPQKVTAIHNPKDCGSTLATMVHELGHAVGFLHEHTRPDRDTHLFIPKEAANGSQVVINYSGSTIGGFDVNSVMMYSSLQIPGMVNRATGAPIPEIIRPSANDIQRAAGEFWRQRTTASGTAVERIFYDCTDQCLSNRNRCQRFISTTRNQRRQHTLLQLLGQSIQRWQADYRLPEFIRRQIVFLHQENTRQWKDHRRGGRHQSRCWSGAFTASCAAQLHRANECMSRHIWNSRLISTLGI